MAESDSVIIDNLDEKDGKNNVSPEQLIHFVDLVNTPKPSLNPVIRRIPLISQSLTYLIYFKRVIIYLFLTLIFNITLPITNPFEFIITFALFPLFTVLVFFFEAGIKFMIFLQSLSPSGNNQKVIDLWSSFTDKDIKEILRAGIASLDDPDTHSDDNKYPTFNLNRAELLLYTSALMGQRDLTLVEEAQNDIIELKKNPEKARSEDIKKITDKLLESEKAIREEAKEIGLEFISITECNVIEGPYGGLYWSEKQNFIIVSFKGTDPLNMAEWLTNFSLQRMDAKRFLFGEVHSGYYTNLFPDNSYSSTKSEKQFPALRLIEAIRGKANEIYKRTAQRVKVWVTGYSLGGALATLFYARLLQSPASLGDNVDICDGITFASPLLGDNDFATGFQSLMNNEINVNKNFWRIVNDNDIAPRFPLGFHVPNLGHFLSKINLFNYINVGDEVRFYQDGSKPSSERHLYGPDINYLFIKQELNLVDLGTFFGFSDQFDSSTNGRNSIKNIFTVNYKVNSKIDYITPGFIRNHYSYRYFECLEKGRKYWEEPKKIDEK
ncbi:alpha/beta-hydrolase [Gigaspora margarita]|uniref:Alpha/beta-hydrolase n=1 Tax=Gigaspora margarita TaxID=4874 RepID=A0A8H4AK80_GIGMA|nr:alpha/beta-hydrolase [Gigaspora margarita]